MDAQQLGNREEIVEMIHEGIAGQNKSGEA